VAEEKKRKPLIEAIISKMDGLDILAEIAGEKKQEKKEVAPQDTLGGILQTLPMLVMLPAVMPLIQQMMTQTLSSTTVNVKVESATAILPIEISASTAIVPIEIKASSVTLNVNITGSDAILNVNANVTNANLNVVLQSQAVDLKIYTPSGKWVSASDLVGTYIDAYGVLISPNQETTIISVSGKRGRLKYIGMNIKNYVGSINLTQYLRLRIYIDGSLKADIPLDRIDLFMGFPVEKLRQSLAHHIYTGLSWPFNTSRIGTNPDKYLVMPFFSGPRGGITYFIYDYTNAIITEIGLYINVEFEFTNSFVVKIYNSHSSAQPDCTVMVMIGEYL
jgi:hypothetical protein